VGSGGVSRVECWGEAMRGCGAGSPAPRQAGRLAATGWGSFARMEGVDGFMVFLTDDSKTAAGVVVSGERIGTIFERLLLAANGKAGETRRARIFTNFFGGWRGAKRGGGWFSGRGARRRGVAGLEARRYGKQGRLPLRERVEIGENRDAAGGVAIRKNLQKLLLRWGTFPQTLQPSISGQEMMAKSHWQKRP